MQPSDATKGSAVEHDHNPAHAGLALRHDAPVSPNLTALDASKVAEGSMIHFGKAFLRQYTR